MLNSIIAGIDSKMISTGCVDGTFTISPVAVSICLPLLIVFKLSLSTRELEIKDRIAPLSRITCTSIPFISAVHFGSSSSAKAIAVSSGFLFL